MEAYTYLIKSKTTGKCYYGVRWANKVSPSNDLWIKYFTSSNQVKNLINLYGKNDFLFEVRKIFTTKQEAILWEETVLKRLNVLYNSHIWLNKCISKAIRYVIHPREGKSVSIDTRNKISNSNKGKIKFTLEQRLQMSKDRSNAGHWNYGKKHSKITNNKNSNTNKENWLLKLQDPAFLEKHIEKSIANRISSWILEDSFGEQITVTNLNKFCRDNKLHASNFFNKGHCKGYKLISKIQNS